MATEAGARKQIGPAANIPGVKKRSPPWNTSELGNRIKLVKACAKVFPWDKAHKSKLEAWEKVCEDVNGTNLVPDGPVLRYSTAKSCIESLLDEMTKIYEDQSEQMKGSGTVTMDTSFQMELQPLWSRWNEWTVWGTLFQTTHLL